MLADYPSLSADDLRSVLVHSRERILPELSASLADYALERMRARGVTLELNARVSAARPGIVILKRMTLEKTHPTNKPQHYTLEISTAPLLSPPFPRPRP